VARISVLDTGPLGLACRKPSDERLEPFRIWLFQAQAANTVVVIPEIANYELRRELLRSRKLASVDRLDRLRSSPYYSYVRLSTPAIDRAAELWAHARSFGHQTAEDPGLDGDVILAAQALEYSGARDILTVATDNSRHLGRYLDAKPWQAITP
jgi:predicted nucleic acid-binding protein